MTSGHWLAALAMAFTLPGVAATLPAAAQQADQVERPKSQVPTLGRPTRPNDAPPIFNFEEYFVGKWTFSWEVPDGPLGPAGTITGTTVFKKLDDRFFEAATEGAGPGGPLKITEVIGYLPANKTLTRQVTDTRGFAFLQLGTIGGDLGGYFNIYYQSAPFTFNGTSMQFKSNMKLLSPINFKTETKLSVNGGPYMNFGSPWWHKDVPGLPAKQ